MASEERAPRPPSLIDALLPVLVLIGLIALTIALFGVSATDGPLQVALLLSAAFASLMALKNGYSSAAVADAAIGGVTTAMSAGFPRPAAASGRRTRSHARAPDRSGERERHRAERDR